MTGSNFKSKAFYISLVSSIGAAVVHGILAQKHYALRFGEGASGGLCNINSYFSCDNASNSSFSEFFGTPLALLGLFFNLAFAVTLIISKYNSQERTNSSSKASGQFLSLVILAASLVLFTISILFINTICPYCAITYVLSILTFWGAYSIWGKYNFSQLGQLGQLKKLLLLSLGIFATAKITDSQIESQYISAEDLEYQEIAIKDWTSRPRSEINLVSPLELNSGHQKMHIVEFADFLCGHCKEAYPKLHNFALKQGVRLSFQSFPLDGECNTSVTHVLGSRCLLAKMVYCAENIATKGWAAQEWIFERQQVLNSKESIDLLIPEFSNSLNVNEANLKVCLSKEETHQAIKNQAALGTKLGVEGTPAIFINGKRLNARLTVPLLEQIFTEINKAK